MKTDSPEDRLLRLIKGKHKTKESLEGPCKAKRTFPALDSFRKLIRGKIALRPSSLASVNKTLSIILTLLAIYFIYNLFYIKSKDIDSAISKIEASKAVVDAESKETALPKAEDYSFYSKDIGGKNLFSGSGAKGTESGASTSVEVSKRFNLVGIIAGERPQAIIEDSQTQKTYYLYRGQSVSGVTVQEIGDGRIVLNYEGKEAELVM